MKAARLLLAVLALVVVSACTSSSITGPDTSAGQTEPQHGAYGSGQG